MNQLIILRVFVVLLFVAVLLLISITFYLFLRMRKDRDSMRHFLRGVISQSESILEAFGTTNEISDPLILKKWIASFHHGIILFYQNNFDDDDTDKL